MDLLVGMIITFCLLIYSVLNGFFVGIPLTVGYLIFAIIAWLRGFGVKETIGMSFEGGKKAYVVLVIFVLIGAITGIWMASGTVPGVVFYGIQLMNPKLFILYTFLLTCIVAFLLGTSLGTVGTVGIALMVMAKSGGVDANVAAGAIIAGAYFGDRCSPMSSSANLVANLTGTALYSNILTMFKTGLLPLLVSIGLYGVLSLWHPLNFTGTGIDQEISKAFNINGVVLLPAVVILVLSAFKVNVRLSMLISIGTAAVISVLLQDYSVVEVMMTIGMGFRLEGSETLAAILNGGGIVSMWKASFVIYVSCAMAGIFNGTGMLRGVETLFSKSRTRSGLFANTAAVSVLTAAFGCNQSISTVLTNQIMGNTYRLKGVEEDQLASDLENTGIVLAALIPWNLAAFVPTLTMDVSTTGYLPYAFYLYLLPLMTFGALKLKELRGSGGLLESVKRSV